MSQTSEVLNYLKHHKNGITSLEAINMFGATRLSGIIFVLKRKGNKITTEMKKVKNKYGHTTMVAVYKLEQ